MSEYVSIGIAAKMLGVTPATVRSWDKAGKISSIRLPSNHRRFRLSDLEAILNG